MHFIYMGLTKEINRLLKNRQLCMILAVVVFLGVVISLYNVHKATDTSSYDNSEPASQGAEDQYVGESAPSAAGQVPNPAMPIGLNSGPGSVSGVQTVTGGVPQSCLNQQAANPSDLLPRDRNSAFAAGQPIGGGGELQNVNLLKSGQLSGIDTVGGTLRNANLQLRSEPPNPRTQVSPWSNSTIEPDLMRVPLELGCGSQ